MNNEINEKYEKLKLKANGINLKTLTAEDYIYLEELNKELLLSGNFKQILESYVELIHENLILMLICLVNIKQTRKMGENLFPDLNRSVEIFGKIFENLNKNSEFFFLPSIDVFINLIFKLPDLVIITKKDYFEKLFRMFLWKEIYKCVNIIEKISILKLNKILISAMDINDLEIISIYEESIYFEDFMDALFNIKISQENFQTIFAIFEKLNINVISFDQEAFGRKMFTYIQKNKNICLILFSGNKGLKEFYINSLIQNLEENFDGFDFLTFYIFYLSIYIYLQDNKENKEFIQNILNVQGKVLSKLVTQEMKIIYFLFSEFLRNFFKQDIEYEENHITDADRNILAFDIIYQNLLKNKFYLNEFEQILSKKFNLKPKEKIQKPEKKIKYKSIKFQKKYGVYEKSQNILLEPENVEPEIKLKINKNGKFSFLKINLEQEDDISDLKVLNKPTHIKDCILGINSEYPDRQKLSLEALPDIITSNPFDLNYHLDSLSEALLKATNTFEIDSFDELIEAVLIKLIINSSIKMTQILCKRFFLEECSLKQKYQILTVFEKAAEEIVNVSSQKATVNKLHNYFEFIIFPLLHYLKITDIDKMLKIKEFDFLLGKFLVLITKLIKFSENHPLVYKALFESFDLFKTIS
jgi:hypothetical protein